MPISHAGHDYHTLQSKAYNELKNLVQLHPTGAYNPDPFAVFNPDPSIKIVWADPNKVLAKKAKYRAEVVNAEDGVKKYQIPTKEINLSKNCVERLGLVMMRYNMVNYEARVAVHAYQFLNATGKPIDDFNNSQGVDARVMNGSPGKERAVSPSSSSHVSPGGHEVNEAMHLIRDLGHKMEQVGNTSVADTVDIIDGVNVINIEKED